MARRRRSLGAPFDNVPTWQLAVGVAAIGGAVWYFTRPKKAKAVTVTVAVPTPPTDLVVTGSSAPPAQPGITPMATMTAARPSAVQQQSPVAANIKSAFMRQLATPKQTEATAVMAADPCAGLTGRAALDCRSAAAQLELDQTLARQ